MMQDLNKAVELIAYRLHVSSVTPFYFASIILQNTKVTTDHFTDPLRAARTDGIWAID